VLLNARKYVRRNIIMIRALAATLAFSALALAAQPMPADAHGPSRQKVTKTIEINAPVDRSGRSLAISRI